MSTDARELLSRQIAAQLAAWPSTRGAIVRVELLDDRDVILGEWVDGAVSTCAGHVADAIVDCASREERRVLCSVRVHVAARAAKGARGEGAATWRWSARPEAADARTHRAEGLSLTDVRAMLAVHVEAAQQAHALLRETVTAQASATATLVKAQTEALRAQTESAARLVDGVTAMLAQTTTRANAAVADRDALVEATRETSQLAREAVDRAEKAERELAEDPTRIIAREATRQLLDRGVLGAVIGAVAEAAMPSTSSPAPTAPAQVLPADQARALLGGGSTAAEA